MPTKKNLSRNARHSYESHIRLYLIPYLGAVRIDKLRGARVADMFAQIAEHNEEITAARASNDAARRAAVKWPRPVGPSSMHRIRETLRAALNAAMRDEWLTVNVAKLVEMLPADRPKGRMWTPERVAHWESTGQIPSAMMVWTCTRALVARDRSCGGGWVGVRPCGWPVLESELPQPRLRAVGAGG